MNFKYTQEMLDHVEKSAEPLHDMHGELMKQITRQRIAEPYKPIIVTALGETLYTIPALVRRIQ